MQQLLDDQRPERTGKEDLRGFERYFSPTSSPFTGSIPTALSHRKAHRRSHRALPHARPGGRANDDRGIVARRPGLALETPRSRVYNPRNGVWPASRLRRSAERRLAESRRGHS
jgi:hypothetical protein